MSIEIPAEPDRLDKILADIYEHGGKVTLGQDWVWLQRVQHEMPPWAKPIFDKYKNVPHVHADKLKSAIRLRVR